MTSSKSYSSTTFPQPPRWAVVIAGSGGSLSPLRVLVGSLTAALDAAYVCLVPFPINTLGHVADILQAAAEIPVRPAVDCDRLRRGQVFVVSSNQMPFIDDETLRVTTMLGSGVRHVRTSAVDSLFSSAARSFGAAAIGIGLSGPEDEGAAGAQAIKAAGGVVLVQSPLEAIHPRMPEVILSAVEADACAGTHELALRLRELCEVKPVERAAEAS